MSDKPQRMLDKPILVLDFDGVIHSYEKGWHDGTIYGRTTDGFWEWAIKAAKVFRLCVHSSRLKTAADCGEVSRWMLAEFDAWRTDAGRQHAQYPYFELSTTKPPAFLTIDDRALCFHGDWRAPFLEPQSLHAFKSWVAAKAPLPAPEKPQNNAVSRETS